MSRTIILLAVIGSIVLSQELTAIAATWRSLDGKHTTEATFISLDGDSVRLLTKENKTITVKLEKLDDESRKQAKELASKSKQQTVAAPAKTVSKMVVEGKTPLQWIERLRKSNETREIVNASLHRKWSLLAPSCGEAEVAQLGQLLRRYAMDPADSSAEGACDVLVYLGPIASGAERELLAAYLTARKNGQGHGRFTPYDRAGLRCLNVLQMIGPSKATCDRLSVDLMGMNPIDRYYHSVGQVFEAASWENSQTPIQKMIIAEAKKAEGSRLGFFLGLLTSRQPLSLDDQIINVVKNSLSDKDNETYSYSKCAQSIEKLSRVGPALAPLAKDIMAIEQETITRRLEIISRMGPSARPALETYVDLLSDADKSVREAAYKTFAAVAPDLIKKDSSLSDRPDIMLPWLERPAKKEWVLGLSAEKLQHGAKLAACGVFLTVYDKPEGPYVRATMTHKWCEYRPWAESDEVLLSMDGTESQAIKTLAAGPIQVQELYIDGPISDASIATISGMSSLKKLTLVNLERRLLTQQGIDQLSSLKKSIEVDTHGFDNPRVVEE